MHQRSESTQPKRKTSSINNHLSNSRKRKESLRRTWSDGLPSLASNTVKMVVATLQLSDTMTDLYGEKNDINNEQEQEQDDDYDDILNIGQQVQAHIPDIVLNNLNDLIDRKGNISIPNEHKYNNATLLFLDVSGFTALTEQYSNAAHLGIDQLTRTLNSYFAHLVYEILTHHGDIYKFAGDAILALWVNETTGPEQALKCALHLQQKCGAYETDVGVILRLKVALAYGPIRALFVGIDEFKHYLLTGDGVKDVNICEQLCEPGDIIITKAVYNQIQSISFNCEFEPVSDDIDPKHEYIAVKYSQSTESSCNEDSDTEDHISSSTMINDRMVCMYKHFEKLSIYTKRYRNGEKKHNDDHYR
jgi:class 3 adenylate cyclase